MELQPFGFDPTIWGITPLHCRHGTFLQPLDNWGRMCGHGWGKTPVRD